ncbi:hypothetical protein [Megamonas hypermegale]|uniref:hypothetical protein n=1 Tax=Megamonas hypermegale TaxID=158847 RepID=UPI0026F2B2D7|nr:hypothetical protein [Megamonas hypermegale]
MDNVKVNSKHVGISFDDYLDSRLTEEEKNYIDWQADFLIASKVPCEKRAIYTAKTLW